ncbi:MAG: hypothetical protein ACE5J2_02515 [Nitrososphaerales archaeon]
MKKFLVYGLSLIALLASAATVPVWAQIYGGGAGGAAVATPEQIEECKQLGIPEFTCSEHQILAKKRVLTSEQAGAYGSGTPLFGKTFGDMGALIAVLGAIFGGVAAAFFFKSRKESPKQ